MIQHMFVSVTRLHLRSRRFLLPFLFYTWRSARQVKRSHGFRGGQIGNDAQSGNWTITVWDGEADMRAFRNADPHKTAMRKLLDWCDEASFAHYAADTDQLPSADIAYDCLRTGKISKVNHPSPEHAAGRTVSEGKPRFAMKLKT
jgi:heme-degrading monooxygenase HmoA